MKLPEAVGEYLDWLALDRHASPNTVRAYRDDLGRFVAFAGGDAAPAVADIDRDLLRAFQRQLATSGLAPATQARRLVALRSFLKFCALEEWTRGDYGAGITVPRLPERLPKPLEAGDREQLGQLAHSTPLEKRDLALMLFLLSTGCRISEALALNRDDWRRDRLTVRGKGDRERVVTVTTRARQAVDDYLASRDDPSPALWIGFARPNSGQRDNRLTVEGARWICRRIAQRLGLPAYSPHRLRHTLGTLLQETMGDARLTAETLGHRGLASVAGYTKITDARRRAAYEAMESAGL